MGTRSASGCLPRTFPIPDTPNFRPRDLVEPKFDKARRGGRRRVGTLPMMQTSATHMAALGSARRRSTMTAARAGFQTRPAGNAVNLEEQMLKVVGQPDGLCSRHVALQPKACDLLKTAIGKG